MLGPVTVPHTVTAVPGGIQGLASNKAKVAPLEPLTPRHIGAIGCVQPTATGGGDALFFLAASAAVTASAPAKRDGQRQPIFCRHASLLHNCTMRADCNCGPAVSNWTLSRAVMPCPAFARRVAAGSRARRGGVVPPFPFQRIGGPAPTGCQCALCRIASRWRALRNCFPLASLALLSGSNIADKCPFQAANFARFGRRCALPPIATVQHAGLAQGTFENRPIREKATASRDK